MATCSQSMQRTWWLVARTPIVTGSYWHVIQTAYFSIICNSWRRHQMETFSALLAICAGNSPVSGEFPAQRPVTRSFDIFFVVRLIKRLSKHSRVWWFETLSHPLWRHRNDDQRIVAFSNFYSWADTLVSETLSLRLSTGAKVTTTKHAGNLHCWLLSFRQHMATCHINISFRLHDVLSCVIIPQSARTKSTLEGCLSLNTGTTMHTVEWS